MGGTKPVGGPGAVRPDMAAPAPKRDRTSDLAARALAAACVLNLNGVFTMAFDLGQAASIVMLFTSILLIFKCGRAPISAPMLLLTTAMGSYLLLATFFFDPLEAVFEPGKFYQAYFGGILIIWAIAGYVASLPPGPRLGQFLRFVRNAFLVSAASVWASPLLYQYYVNLPLSAEQRMGGFFANPNEAAMASLLAIALMLGIPFRLKLLQIPLLLMAAGAVILTFSKTAMSALVLILAWHLLQRARGAMLILLPVAAFFAVVAIQDLDEVLTAIVENPVIELSDAQKSRILAVSKILSGEINESTSTGRTYLWGLVFEKAWDRFPLGSGLGSAHNIVGGVLQNDTWQGAHNTLIMMMGESGPLPPALLLAAMAALFVAILRSSVGLMEMPCLFVLMADLMATHTALSTRYHNLMLAVMLGLIANRGVIAAGRALRARTKAPARSMPMVGRTGRLPEALR
jgi:O-Antigen ligase